MRNLLFLFCTLVRRRFIIVGFVCLFTSTSVLAQSHFYKRITGFSVNYEVKVVATPDGGWITGGTSDEIRLLKYDKCGTLQWSKRYICSQIINCMDIVASAFGGYAIAGYAGTDVYNADIYLLRIDDNGNVIYSKEYQAPSSEHTYSLGEDKHGNFFINGNTVPGGTALGNNYILKTDSLGNILWCKLYAGGGSWALATVCSDGGVLRCAGYGELYKVDSSGTLSWAKSGYWNTRYEPAEVGDGYVLGNYYGGRACIVKLDFNGNFVWCSNQFTAPLTFQRMAVTSSDKITMITNNYVIEFDKNGKYITHNYFENTATSVYPTLTDICLLKNKSFIISGFETVSVFNGKIDSLLHSGCADKNIALDTIGPTTFPVTNTSYAVVNKVFTTTNLFVTETDFSPGEEIVCAEYDSLSFTANLPTTVCSGTPVSLSVNCTANSADVTWNWCVDSCSGASAGTGSPLIISPSATHTYFVSGKNGCDTTSCIPVTVNVNTKPDANFTTDYEVNCQGVTIDLNNQSINADSYDWNFNDGFTSNQTNIIHHINNSTPLNISLIAINNNSCRDTMTLQNNMTSFSDYLNIIIPNVFTPNNDGVNDDFQILSQSDLSDCFSISIFDRWGIKLFSSNNYHSKWDGRTASGTIATAGTYFYILKVNDAEYKGEIMLIE